MYIIYLYENPRMEGKTFLRNDRNVMCYVHRKK